MDHKRLQKEILSCIPLDTLKEQIAIQNYIFTQEELLSIAYHYAPTFEERLRLMQLLADHAHGVSEHAKKCVQWQKDILEQFRHRQEDQVYVLCIKESPEAYEERYICRTFETAMETIDGFYKEYDMAEESSHASYVIEKQKVLSPGEPFQEGHLGECRLATGKVLISVDPADVSSEFGPCTCDCWDCPRDCVSQKEVTFPVCIPDRAPACYAEGDGFLHYGIHLNLDHAERLPEYYIIPFDSTLLEDGNYDQDWPCHGHRHIPVPYAYEVSPRELPEAFRKRYDSFILWLNNRFDEYYKMRETESAT